MAELVSSEQDGVLVVNFTQGKILSDVVIAAIGRELLDLGEKAAAGKKLLLNFRGVSFMSSAMIGKIVLLHKKCKKDGIDVKLCEISDGIREVFTITRLDKVFDILDTEEKAIAKFNKKGWFG